MQPTAAPTQAQLVRRHFTESGVDPLDQVEWEIRDAWPNNPQYHRENLEVPKAWSQEALDITSKLYLAKGGYSEDSLRTLIERVAFQVRDEGQLGGYFPTIEQHDTFFDELKHILVNQLAAFNSPVWFNVGRPDRPQQVSACFILGVDDTTDSIVNTSEREFRIFKGGSGSGFNVSKLRGSMEPLSPGGLASGPVSFMRFWDAGAGTIKSGGTTRRAAKLVRMDADHPDIIDFIRAKVREEERLRILAEAGINISMDAEGERNVAEATSFQNANNSVGVTDKFMEAATSSSDGDPQWPLIARKTGAVVDTVNARELLTMVAHAAHACACPGLQYDTTINAWHTTPAQGPITSSNPCGEYLSNDDTSCNLASINLLKFVDEHGRFDVGAFRQVVDVMTVAMDILIGFASFPDDPEFGGDGRIGERTRALRQLGLGYSNLGAAIMAQGLAYDSHEARDFAAAVTSLLTGRCYLRSALMAEELGPFEHFEENRASMLDVMDKHLSWLPEDRGDEALTEGELAYRPEQLWSAAITDWHHAVALGQKVGYRNAQASVIAPAGSISYLMDCDTTGAEPAFTLVSYKELAGGGSMKLINKSVQRAARALGGYSEGNLQQLADDDFSCIADEDRPVFYGANEISPEGHVRMLAAIQPWVSGGISKTINLAEDTSVQEIRDIYVLAWKLGCKDLAIYRNNSKARQVLAGAPKKTVDVVTPRSGPHPDIVQADEVDLLPQATTPHAEDQYEGPVGPERRRMPRDADMRRHKFNVGGFEGYLLMGLYEDGSLGEIFIEDIGKEGSTLRGMINAWAIQVSTALQYGQPLETLVRKYIHMNFEPNGRTENLEIPTAESLPAYIVKVLARNFLPSEIHEELGILTEEVKRRRMADLDARDALMAAISHDEDGTVQVDQSILLEKLNGSADTMATMAMAVTATSGDQRVPAGPPCQQCGGVMFRAGACWQCRCGNSTGCG
jgi:ribonucleoside-diphosphate reductase alpha chain